MLRLLLIGDCSNEAMAKVTLSSRPSFNTAPKRLYLFFNITRQIYFILMYFVFDFHCCCEYAVIIIIY